MNVPLWGTIGWLVGIIVACVVLLSGWAGPVWGAGALAIWFSLGLAGAIVGAIYGYFTRPKAAPAVAARRR